MTGEGRVLSRRGFWRLWVALGLVVVVGAPGFVVQRGVLASGWASLTRLDPFYAIDPYLTSVSEGGNGLRVAVDLDRRRHGGLADTARYSDRARVYVDGRYVGEVEFDESFHSVECRFGVYPLAPEPEPSASGEPARQFQLAFISGPKTKSHSVYEWSYMVTDEEIELVGTSLSTHRTWLRQGIRRALRPAAESGFDLDVNTAPAGAWNPSFIGPQRP